MNDVFNVLEEGFDDSASLGDFVALINKGFNFLPHDMLKYISYTLIAIVVIGIFTIIIRAIS